MGAEPSSNFGLLWSQRNGCSVGDIPRACSVGNIPRVCCTKCIERSFIVSRWCMSGFIFRGLVSLYVPTVGVIDPKFLTPVSWGNVVGVDSLSLFRCCSCGDMDGRGTVLVETESGFRGGRCGPVRLKTKMGKKTWVCTGAPAMGPGIMDKFPGGAVCGLGPGLDGLILRLEAPGAGSAIWWTCGADDVVVVSCPSLGASVVAICWICWTSGWPLMKINWYDMAANGVRSHVLENQLFILKWWWLGMWNSQLYMTFTGKG